MYLQKVGDTLVGVDLVLHSREAVAFILVDFQLHRAAVFLHGVGHLLRLLRRTTGIVASANSSSGALI